MPPRQQGFWDSGSEWKGVAQNFDQILKFSFLHVGEFDVICWALDNWSLCISILPILTFPTMNIQKLSASKVKMCWAVKRHPQKSNEEILTKFHPRQIRKTVIWKSWREIYSWIWKLHSEFGWGWTVKLVLKKRWKKYFPTNWREEQNRKIKYFLEREISFLLLLPFEMFINTQIKEIKWRRLLSHNAQKVSLTHVKCRTDMMVVSLELRWNPHVYS